MAKKLESDLITKESLVATLESAKKNVKAGVASLGDIKDLDGSSLYYIAGGLSLVEMGLDAAISFIKKAD